jgi:hypothetical protein
MLLTKGLRQPEKIIFTEAEKVLGKITGNTGGDKSSYTEETLETLRRGGGHCLLFKGVNAPSLHGKY